MSTLRAPAPPSMLDVINDGAPESNPAMTIDELECMSNIGWVGLQNGMLAYYLSQIPWTDEFQEGLVARCNPDVTERRSPTGKEVA